MEDLIIRHSLTFGRLAANRSVFLADRDFRCVWLQVRILGGALP